MKKFLIILALLLGSLSVAASGSVPVIGAQVFIELGQSSEEVDGWFRTLRENGMEVCRIRLFEEYIHNGSKWDYSLFDRAFDAAAKYDIKIFLTLFPTDPDRSIGGFKFPFTKAHKTAIATYIKNVVTHYRSHPNLMGWVLLNEPGTDGVLPETKYTRDCFKQWKAARPVWNGGGYERLMDFDKEAFLVNHTTDFLGWIAAEIRKYDQEHELHVNNHQIFNNIAEYDFPAWRQFLTSLGASAHPSWHFGYFSRDRFAVAMSANCNIVRSGAGALPFWITELQGGNNTYSAFNPFCPTADEITQWMWTSITAGIDGLIFWSLNPRAVGGEAGEWGLVNFQNGPSDRLEAAREVIETIHGNPEFFSSIKPVDSGITLLYLRESLWAERKVQMGDLGDARYEGRHQGGVIKSILGIYEMMLENGIGAQIAEFREFDWTQESYKGRTLVLAGQVCLPSESWEPLRSFVRKGGKLIVEGLTGWYDENMRCRFQTGFPLEDVFGGCLQESKCTPGDFTMEIGGKVLPVHLWKSFILPKGGEPVSLEAEGVTALRNRFGGGEVLWIPSCIAIGARRASDYIALSALLLPELAQLPVIRLAQPCPGVMVQRFHSGDREAALVINKSGKTQIVSFSIPAVSLIYADKKAELKVGSLQLCPEECAIVCW
ncbi:MAG: beta-galactosidase [Bacteroidales bacterium]|nr:beta-galactosidase [Bacteroidales bacterium]